MSEPLSNGGANGKDASGRFVSGNRAAVGRGNPHAAEVGRHRAQFFQSIRDDDVETAVETIREVMNDTKARASDRLAAARELLDRVLGRPEQAIILDKITELERELGICGDEE